LRSDNSSSSAARFASTVDGGTLVGQVEEPETSELVTSCTDHLTAQRLTRTIRDRTPVVLDKAEIRAWLDGAADTALLKPAAEGRLRLLWPVSRHRR
jgi:putative SOS response-associated peptidase YedK